MKTAVLHRRLLAALLLALLAACSARPAAPAPTPTPTEDPDRLACAVTEPAWVKPPEDSAVPDPPAFGYYYVNSDSSMMASAGWSIPEEFDLHAGGEGVKVGWFRPAGAELVISGRRIDGDAPPLEAHASCCYPTRFQASGLYFPSKGCWEIHAQAAESELTFVVWVPP